MILELKILKGLGTEAVRKRELRIKNQTNRDIKAYAFWTFLKNQTESGFLHRYHEQIDTFLPLLKISYGTFYTYLKYAEQLNLVTRQEGALKLASYDFVMKQLDIFEKDFYIVNYDTEHPKQKIEHILNALEFQENSEKQEKAIEVKISKNSIIKSAFQLYWIQQGVQMEFNLHNLKKTQQLIFEAGAADRIYIPLMELVNPEIFRNSRTIAAAHNYKARRLVTYLKRKLKRGGLVGVYNNEKAVCRYNKNKVEGNTRGKNENAFCFYNPKDKEKYWSKPQTVIINPTLIKICQKIELEKVA